MAGTSTRKSGLDQETAGALLDHRFSDIAGVIRGHEYDLTFCGNSFEVSSHLDSIEGWEANVQHHEVGLHRLGFLHRLQAVGSFFNHEPPQLSLEVHTKNFSPWRKVVHDERTNSLHFSGVVAAGRSSLGDHVSTWSIWNARSAGKG